MISVNPERESGIVGPFRFHRVNRWLLGFSISRIGLELYLLWWVVIVRFV